MGRELYDTQPAFTEALDAAVEQFDRHLDHSLRGVLFAEEGSPEAKLLDQTAFTQPALFAVEVALYRLVASWGVTPAYLLGHSIGEVAAAHVAGVLSLPDACTLVAARGTLMQALPGGGAMVAVEASESEVAGDLAGLEDRMSVAGVNGPSEVVLSGDEEAVEGCAARWRERGRKTKRLRVSHAFHSPRMEPMLARFAEVAAGLTYAAPRIPVVSNLTGAPARPEELQRAAYWVRQVREAVRFLDGMRWLDQAGVSCFLEVGPGGTLSALAQGCLATPPAGQADGAAPVFAALLPQGHHQEHAFVTALAEADCRLGCVDWAVPFAGGRRVDLPTYAFQRRRYWLEVSPSRGRDGNAGAPASSPAVAGDGAAEDVAESFRERLAGAGEEQRDELVSGLVRATAAAVLGLDSPGEVEVDRPLLEIGFDSLGAVRLHRRLAEATGLDLPQSLLVDRPTLAGVTGYLCAELAAAGSTPAPLPEQETRSAGASPGRTLVAALHHAHERGATVEVVPLLTEVSRFRPSFDLVSGEKDVPEPVLVADGPGHPVLVCLPSFVVGSGPHQFVRFGAGFGGSRKVLSLSLPGFRRDRLPATAAAAVAALAQQALRAAAGEEFVLLGYSSGGVLAHAVAEHLERAGRPAGGLVLVDTYAHDEAEIGRVLASVIDDLLARGHDYLAIDDDGLAAMGAYVRLFAGWRASSLGAPSLLLRATTPLAGTVTDDARLAGTVVPVDTDHYAILEDDAALAAGIVQRWLGGPRRGPVPTGTAGGRGV